MMHVSVAGLRKIRAHLRIINDSSAKRSHRHGSRSRSRGTTNGGNSGKQTQRSRDEDQRRKSVRFDIHQTYYVPDPPQRYQDVEWPQSAGSIEYFPVKDQFPAKEEEGPEVVRLARLQRSSSVSYQRSASPPKPGSRRSETAARYEKERGRSQRREARDAGARADDDSSDASWHEKLGYRSKR
jgi:hypothetical protein